MAAKKKITRDVLNIQIPPEPGCFPIEVRVTMIYRDESKPVPSAGIGGNSSSLRNALHPGNRKN